MADEHIDWEAQWAEAEQEHLEQQSDETPDTEAAGEDGPDGSADQSKEGQDASGGDAPEAGEGTQGATEESGGGETPAQEATTGPTTPDYKALFGVESESDVKKALQERDELKKKIEEYEGKEPEYANESIGRLDRLMKAHPDMEYSVALAMSSLTEETLKDMDDLSVIKLQLEMEKPGLRGKDNLLDRQLRKKYTFMPDQDTLDDMSEAEIQELKEEVELSKTDMAQDAAKYRKDLNATLSKSQPPKKEVVDVEKQKQELRDAWAEPSKKIIPQQLSIPDGEWDKELMKFSIEQSEFDKLVESVPDYAANNGIQLTEDSFKQISEQLMTNLIVGKLPKIIRSVKDKVAAETRLEVEKEYTNPSGSRMEESKGAPPSNDEVDISIFE